MRTIHVQWPNPAANGRKSRALQNEAHDYYRRQLLMLRKSGLQQAQRGVQFQPPDLYNATDEDDDEDADNDQALRKQWQQMDLDTQHLLDSSPHIESESDNDGTTPLIDEDYWRKKGMILGQILDEGVDCNPEVDENFMHTTFENQLYKKFLLFIEVAPAMIKTLQRGNLNDAGSALSARLDRVIDLGRQQAHQADANGVCSAIGQWPSINWEPAFPVVHHLLSFNHNTSGQLLCPITLDWDDAKVREGLCHGTQDLTAVDLPTFLWPDGAFYTEDAYNSFLCSPLLVTTYKHIFISPSSANKTNKSTRGGNAALHNITFVTYESIAYVATVTCFALSDEPSFGPGGSDADKRRRRGFPYRMFYCEILDHKDLMSEDELISLIQWWNKKIFPHTIYTSNTLRKGSAGVIMWENARAKHIEHEAAERTVVEHVSGSTTSISEEI
ncbi:hypothetical protein V8E53_011668 [Lactarius tabidus]